MCYNNGWSLFFVWTANRSQTGLAAARHCFFYITAWDRVKALAMLKMFMKISCSEIYGKFVPF
jgi:hypothetical protein